MQSKHDSFGSNHSDKGAFARTIWLKNVDFKPHQQKIIILPVDVYISEFQAPQLILKNKTSSREEEPIPFKKLYICCLTDNGRRFEIIEHKNSNYTRFDHNFIYCPPAFLPKKSVDFFFYHLAINLKQLEKLSEKNYQNIKDFTVAGGSLILIDDLPSTRKPGKRACELLPLKFGNKNSILPESFAQALTAYTIDPKKLPPFRNFSYPFKSKNIEAEIPVYQTYYAKGLITYFGFDISETGHPEGFFKTAWFNRNQNKFNSQLLEDLIKQKRSKAELGSWDYLFAILANPMVLVALGITLFNIILFITLILKNNCSQFQISSF